MPEKDLEDLLALTEAGEVWGVGSRYRDQLREVGVHSVLDLRRMNPAQVQARWGVVMAMAYLSWDGSRV